MPDNQALKSIQDNIAAINDIRLASDNMQSAIGITNQLKAINELTAVLTRLGLMGSTDTEKTQNDVSDSADIADRSAVDIPAKVAARQKANDAAIALLERIESDGLSRSDLSEDEIATLAKYTGSGGGLTAKDGRRGSQYEYYTPPEIASALWDMASDMGFTGGKVLDPSAGTGVFAATSPDKAVIDSIELDAVSGGIAKVLNDGNRSNTIVSPFEEQAKKMADNSLDMVITNVPFGGNKVRGANAGKDDCYQSESLENYFILRSLEKLKHGGLAVFITPTSVVSSRKADKVKLRKLTSLKAEFMGAYRMPTEVFDQTGADVVTDVVIYRKHSLEATEQIKELYTSGNIDDLTSSKVFWDDYLSGKYFEKSYHKKFILGDEVEINNKWGQEVTVVKQNPKNPEVHKMLKKFGGSRIDWAALNTAESQFISYKNGDTVFQNGKQLEYQGGQWKIIEAKNNSTELDIQNQLASMGSAMDIISAGMTYEQVATMFKYSQDTGQAGLLPDNVLIMLKRAEDGVADNKRSAAWDCAIAAQAIRDSIAAHDYGFDFMEGEPLLTKFMKTAFLDGKNSKFTGNAKQDHNFIALYYDKGNYNAVWRGDIDTAIVDNASASSYESALAKMQYDNKSLYLSPEQLEVVSPGVNPLVSDDWFVNHDGTQVIAANDFLTGSLSARLADIDEQLKKATDSGVINKLKKQKIIAMDSVTRINIKNVDFDLRTPLISAEDKVRFLKQAGYPDAFVTLDKYNKPRPDIDVKNSDADIAKLTNRIGDWLGNGSVSIPNMKFKKMTERQALDWLAEKINEANVKFNNWVKVNDSIIAGLEAKMNNNDNLFFSQNADESPIDIAGMNPKLNLHGYQNAYVRQQGRFFGGINGFGVGLGKTFTSLASVQHTQNIGAKKKTIFVVPNSVLSNWRKEADFAYQNTDDCLFIGLREKGDKFRVFPNKYDEDLLTAIDGKYRKIFMTFEAFKRIRLKDTTIDDYSEYVRGNDEAFADRELQKDDEKSSSLTASLISKLAMKTNAPFLEDMRIDSVVIDEAHAFKNSISAPNTGSRIKYLSQPDQSARGEDAQAKLWYIRSLTGNADGVQMLTATPITNSPLEIYSMLSLAGGRDTVNRMFGGISGADDFIKVTCQVDEEVVPTISGGERSQNVFTGIKNAQILRKAVNATAVILDAQDVGMSVVIPDRDEVASRVVLPKNTQDNLKQFQDAYITARMIEKDDPALRLLSKDHPLSPDNPLSAYNQVAGRYGEANELMAHPFNLIRKMDVMIADDDFSSMVSFYDFEPEQAVIAEKVVKIINEGKKKYVDERKRLSPYTNEADAVAIYKTVEDKQKELVGYKVTVKAAIVFDSGRNRLMIDTLNSNIQTAFETIAEKEKLNLDVSVSAKLSMMTENFKSEQASPRGINADNTTSKIVKQIIFCDHLFLHNKIKRILSKLAGVSANKIAIITGQTNNEPDQMIDIQDGFNAESEDNQYQVIIANKKAEVGINLQRGTQAIHHLTTGWTPDSLEQRNGRGARQGNKTEKVTIYHYDADGTFDEFKRTMIDKKDEWITSVLSNDAGNTIEVSGSITNSEKDALIRLGGNAEAMKEYQENRDAKEREERKKVISKRRKINMDVVDEQLRLSRNIKPEKFFTSDIGDVVTLIRSSFDDQKKINNPKSSMNITNNAIKRKAATDSQAIAKLESILDSFDIFKTDKGWKKIEGEPPISPVITAQQAYDEIFNEMNDSTGDYSNSKKSSWDSKFIYQVMLPPHRKIDASFQYKAELKDDGEYRAMADETKVATRRLIDQSLISANELAEGAGGFAMTLPDNAAEMLIDGRAKIYDGEFISMGSFIIVDEDNEYGAPLALINSDLQPVMIAMKNDFKGDKEFVARKNIGLSDLRIGRLVTADHADYLSCVKKAAALEDGLYEAGNAKNTIYSDILPIVAEYRNDDIVPTWKLMLRDDDNQYMLTNTWTTIMLTLPILKAGSEFSEKAIAMYKAAGIEINTDIKERSFVSNDKSVGVIQNALRPSSPADIYYERLASAVDATGTKLSELDRQLVSNTDLVFWLCIEDYHEGMVNMVNRFAANLKEVPTQYDIEAALVEIFDDQLFNKKHFTSSDIIKKEVKVEILERVYADIAETDKINLISHIEREAKKNVAAAKGVSTSETLPTDCVYIGGKTMENKDTIKAYASSHGTKVSFGRRSAKYIWIGKKSVWAISYGAWQKMIEDKPGFTAEGELVMFKSI